MQNIIDFEDAAFLFADEIRKVIGNKIADGRILRDVFGQLSYVVPQTVSENDIQALKAAEFSGSVDYIDRNDPLIFQDTELSYDLLHEHGQVFDLDEGCERFLSKPLNCMLPQVSPRRSRLLFAVAGH